MGDHPELNNLPEILEGIKVQEILREFFRNPSHGQPDNISKAGCLALYMKSTEVGSDGTRHVLWNAWREAFPATKTLNHTDFSAIDFSGGRDSNDFSHFWFGDHANFAEAEFKNNSKFNSAAWGEFCNFQKTRWGSYSEFKNARWGNNTRFERAKWESQSNFSLAQWGEQTNFSAAIWDSHAYFDEAKFGARSSFRGARWNRHARFICASFGELIEFQGAQFGFNTDFQNSCWEGHVTFEARNWDHLRQLLMITDRFVEAKKEAESLGISPDSFLEIDFSGAIFKGVADFSNRQFKNRTRFVGAKFDKVPLFHGCTLHQDTSFEGASFPKPTGNTDDYRAYETLKLAFSKQQAVRTEQLFFQYEMNEELHRQKGLKKLSFWFYKVCSNYGFSITRPLLMWFILLVSFSYLYACISGIHLCISMQSNCVWQIDWLNYSLTQALPVFGIEKAVTVIDDKLIEIPIIWIIIHKTLSLTFLFLTGLALRNLFKIK